MVDWSGFSDLSETEQGAFLLDVAKQALFGFDRHAEIRAKVAEYLTHARAVLDGSDTAMPDALRFMDDPDMAQDFTVYYGQIAGDDEAMAALDLASYASAFAIRLGAARAGVTALPDPVLEALPDIAEYYQDRADQLGL